MSPSDRTSQKGQQPKEVLPGIRLVGNVGWKVVEINGVAAEIPSEWETALLGNAFEINGGGTPSTNDPAYWGGGIVWVGPKYMGNHTRFVEVAQKGMKTLSREGANRVANKPTPAGSLIVSSRAPVGYANMTPCELYTNQGCYSFIDNSKGNPEHLYFWVRKHRALLETRASGTTFLEISRKAISLIEYASPPRAEQTLIAQVLTAQETQVHDLRKLAATERQRLTWLSDELLSGRLRVVKDPAAERVVVSYDEKGEPVEVLPGVRVIENKGWKTVEVNRKKVEIPEDWSAGPLSSVAHVTAGQAPSGSLVITGKPTEQCYDFHQGNANFGETHTLASGKVILKSMAPRKCQKGTLLMSVRAPVGAVNFASTDLCFGRGLCAIEAHRGSDRYIYFQLLKNKSYLQSNAQGSTFEAVKVNDVREMEFLIPNIAEQALIAQVLTAQENQVADLDRLADQEQQRFEWLSEELLSGRLRVKEEG